MRDLTKGSPSNKLICEIPNYMTDILSLAKEKDKIPLYSQFIQKFFSYIPIDYQFREQKELFGRLAYNAFLFFRSRTPLKRKLQISNIKIDGDPAIEVLLLTDNKPFIIDSINCLLMNLNLKAKFLLHPVISCFRSEDGELQEIFNIDKSKCVESLVHITLLGNFNSESIESFSNSLNEILDQVDDTYEVWPLILDKIRSIINTIESRKHFYNDKNINYLESIDFLNWLQNHNFTFLGILDFDLISYQISSDIGVKKIFGTIKNQIIEIINRSIDEPHSNQIIILGKLDCISNVHKNNLVDYILIKHFDSLGKYIGATIVFGLYSLSVNYQSIANIPILRKKLEFVLNKAFCLTDRYNTKKLINIIQTLPIEALIQIDTNDLYCMSLHILSGILSKKLKLFIHHDWSHKFLNVIIFLTRNRLTPKTHSAINFYISQKANGVILSDYITQVAEHFSYLFLTIKTQDGNLNFNVSSMQDDLNAISTSFQDGLTEELYKKFGEYEGGISCKTFYPIFSSEYKEKFAGHTAVEDIEYLIRVTKHNKTFYNLIFIEKKKFYLKIYSIAPKIALSDLLPSIENLGFKAIDECSFSIMASDNNINDSWIYEFTLESSIDIPKNRFTTLKKNVEEALDKINRGILANDSLSKLIILSDFNWWQVKVIKALTRYLHQTGFIYGKGYVQLTLIKHYEFTKNLVDLFDIRFNPNNFSSVNNKKLKEEIEIYLNKIKCNSEDKVLRTMFSIIEAIVRTNCYQSNINGKRKNYLSFKFNSCKISGLPLPIPYAEIFVYENDLFEGIHLRGGKVSRGGIRWSDRGEDYRTEVLGLMKAQMTKNSVIVPVGSKGGFFVHFVKDHFSYKDYLDKVVLCYQNFLRGLLDLTDNIVNGQIIHPNDTVIYDDLDPYLVVAADKGTATFSDYANSIALEYNFWLGDAFASGGSDGYDHKKMAITSKGAWISVKNHFDAIGVDVQSDNITVIGIGDMSGDVFGNGMLRSNSIKLVAAFNHKHIFIDPNPNPEISFLERKRLFEMSGSNWSDYDRNLISVGGGVYDRSSKSIPLSKEAKELLGIIDDSIIPDDLIKAILKADVDLLWNGGIGTYIKASTESHSDIGDKSNDYLRINANALKVKVIGEGGNIGISQLGRIEYSSLGGRINTDFIDNSAGVDCSDHEVNIKIALNKAMSLGKITLKERNQLLIEMTKQVEQIVLIDNYQQNQALNIMQLSPTLNVNIFSQFIDSLEAEKLIDREIEFLPSKEELARKAINNESLVRPELCVLLSYSKSSLSYDLRFETFEDDKKFFEAYLLSYFPSLMQERFREEILSHPLKQDIIKTIITNKLVNQLGGPAINLLKRETEGLIGDIIRAYIIICKIFNLDKLWEEVESLPNSIDYSLRIDMITEISKIIRRGIAWFIKHLKTSFSIEKTINDYLDLSQALSKKIGDLLLGEAKNKFQDRLLLYSNANIDNKLAYNIAVLDSLVSVFDIISIAQRTNKNVLDVASLYFLVATRFNIDWLRILCDKEINNTYWSRLSIQALKDDLYDKQCRLLTKIISYSKENIDLEMWIDTNKISANIFLNFITVLKSQQNIDINILILASKKLETFLCKVE